MSTSTVTKTHSIFGAAVRAELTRAWTLPWTPLLCLLAMALAALTAVMAGASVTVAGTGDESTSSLGPAVGLFLALMVLAVAGSVIVGAGFRSGERRVGLGAVPRRPVLAGATLLALALVTSAAAAAAFLVGRVALAVTGADGPVWGPQALGTALGLVVSTVTFVTVAAALTQLLRNVLVPVALLLLPPLLLLPWVERSLPSLVAVLPYNASTVVINGTRSLELSTTGAYLALVAWTVVAAAVFTLTLSVREG